MTIENDPEMHRCGKCGAPMANPEWCGRCASQRQLWLGLLFFIAGPLVGFGTCLLGVGSSGGTSLMELGLILLVLGPIVGFVLFIMSLISARK
jgi:hypothetical protein